MTARSNSISVSERDRASSVVEGAAYCGVLTKISSDPSGDHDGSSPSVTSVGVEPGATVATIGSSAVSSPLKASVEPSGDHTGSSPPVTKVISELARSKSWISESPSLFSRTKAMVDPSGDHEGSLPGESKVTASLATSKV